MTSTGRNWLILGVVGLVGLMCALTVVNNSSGSDPRPYIQETYQRLPASETPQGTEGGEVYAANGRPSSVADDIHDNARSVDRNNDDGVYYLQYREDMIAVSEQDGQTHVLVDEYREGYERHSSTPGFIFFGWGSSPPSGGFRGGGGGFGGK